MNTAEILVKILENNNVKHIFGHPGEQILPMYNALKQSSIKHVLMRHEQGAVHAADMYARSTGNFSVCISTASPGALNFIMGVSTAYKDSVPVLILTGDNPQSNDLNDFQGFDLPKVFETVTFKNYNPLNGKEAISALNEAVYLLKNHPKGPIHINLPKDVLLDENISNYKNHSDNNYKDNYNYSQLNLLINVLRQSTKPFVIVGNGVLWGHAIDELKEFASKNNIPISTTYPARGIIDESDRINLGMVGMRGTSRSNYAYKNSDLILVLGARLSDRTKGFCDFENIKSKIIHVNIDETVLEGRLKIHGNVLNVLNELNKTKFNNDYGDWWDEINSHNEKQVIEGVHDESLPLKPQAAIQTIYDIIGDAYVLGDAGSHATWAMQCAHPNKFGKFLYSGSLCPMGLGLPGSIGVSMAHPNEKVFVINGDGGFQMCIQELATVRQYNLPITVIILNNSQLGIIRQWEEIISKDFRYEVDLENPDFVKIGEGYHIKSVRVNNITDLRNKLNESMDYNEPYLIEIIVREENIPLPNND